MDVLIVLVFVSIVLVAGGLLLLVFSLNQRDFEHSDRLSLLPLFDPASTTTSASSDSNAAPANSAQDPVPSKT